MSLDLLIFAELGSDYAPFPGPRLHWLTAELDGIDMAVMAANSSRRRESLVQTCAALWRMSAQDWRRQACEDAIGH
jgi:hypothetical protein